jgi:nucleoside-diphosphate-sugar epimerase
VTGRRALVVGGLGFIGCNLSARLAGEGAPVTVLTPSVAAHRELAAEFSSRGIASVDGDIRDAVVMRQLVANQDVVFNLAGQSGAVRSIEDPFADLDVNYRGTLVLLEAVRHVNPAARIVFAGSRLHYGHPASLPVPESAGADPLSLHAVHKSAAESAMQVYAKLFGLTTVMARITNPYGPGQPRERSAYGVINRLVHLAVAGEPLPIYGGGEQLRDYVHVDDVVGALVRMGESPTAAGGVYNVGSGIGTRLIDAATLIVEIARAGRVEHVEWPALASRVETGDFVADISRIERDLAWRPTIAFRQGIEQTVRFYQAHAGS